MQIDIVQAVGLIGAVAQAVMATEHQIVAAIKANRGELTDEQLDAIVDAVMVDAARRKTLADDDVAQAIRDGAQ